MSLDIIEESEWWTREADPNNPRKPKKRKRVRGYRIGRFGIRTKLEDETSAVEAARDESLTWRIDHIPTGYLVTDVEDFQTALAVVDDVSRYARKDPASRDPDRAVQQIGKTSHSVGKWIMDIRRNGYTVGYREWAQDRGQHVQPLRPPRKGPYG